MQTGVGDDVGWARSTWFLTRSGREYKKLRPFCEDATKKKSEQIMYDFAVQVIEVQLQKLLPLGGQIATHERQKPTRA
jgi:hypothetical protein